MPSLFKVKRKTHLDGLLSICLLNNSNNSIRDENQQNDDGFNVGRRFVVSILQEGEHERNPGRDEQDNNELVLELFQY